MFGAAKRDKPFKDYCLILQVHPEADAAMIDAAYWHLAKRYNEAAAYDSNARAKVEELNEAYIVLGSAEKREEYMKVRAQTLGEGALPETPAPQKSPPPVLVMNRQRPREPESTQVAPGQHRSRALQLPALAGLLLLGMAAAALAATTSLLIALAVVGGIFAAALAVAAILVALPRIRALKLPSVPHPEILRMPKSRAAPEPSDGRRLDEITRQAEQLRRVAAQPDHVAPDAKSDPPEQS